MTNREQIDRVRGDKDRLLSELADAGARIKGSAIGCPFHDDKRPSAGVYRRNGVWAFRCHGCGFGGDVIDVFCRSRNCTFQEALTLMGLSQCTQQPQSTNRRPRSARRAGQRVSHRTQGDNDPAVLASQARERLIGDSAALAHLWKTRGVDKATAERFRVGIVGKAGNRFWTFPIVDTDGRVIAVKAHRADGQNKKSWWCPKGADRSHVWPVSTQGPGPVWICPGELKALAVITSGRSAIGITSGEGSKDKPCDLPASAFELLLGHECALVPDDDECGRAWGRMFVGN